MITIAIAGDGQLGRGVALILRSRPDLAVLGPTPRERLNEALASGADVVIVATTTLLADVADQIRVAISHGSNVIVSAEEAAYPWVVDASLANELDEEARRAGVTIVGAGLNPGFVFDALVLTLLGALEDVESIEVTRTVDLSGFGATVAGRLGLGVTADEFEERVADGRILGHAGFPQSMSVVGAAIGHPIVRIDTELSAVIGPDGLTTGIEQKYDAIGVDEQSWFRARFSGHINLGAAGRTAGDEFRFRRTGAEDFLCILSPGIGSQSGSRAIISNSIERVIAAQPGWCTVADLPPAYPVSASPLSTPTH